MSRINALKFLLLQTLNKNKSKINHSLHEEIARSLNIDLKKECFILTWLSNGKSKEITIDEKKFNFYIKSEFEQSSNEKQIDLNESNAHGIVTEIIRFSL